MNFARVRRCRFGSRRIWWDKGIRRCPLIFQILERAVLKFDFVVRKMEIEDFTAVEDGIPL
jgi:hypothetical protein